MKTKYILKPDGSVEMEVIDGDGQDCLRRTQAIEKRLGIQIGDRKLKPEFHVEQEVETEVEEQKEFG